MTSIFRTGFPLCHSMFLYRLGMIDTLKTMGITDDEIQQLKTMSPHVKIHFNETIGAYLRMA